MNETVAFIHLGCAKNLVDAEVMGGRLVRAGYRMVEDPDEADVVIINTCGFIDAAKEESLDEIFQHAWHRRGSLVVAGCLAQRHPDALAEEIPEIDALVGVNDLHHIEEVVADALARRRSVRVSPSEDTRVVYDAADRYRQTPGHFGYVRIAHGCSRSCSFCAIPRIRGPYRSKQPDVVLAEAAALVEDGAREIILIAQDTTLYGVDLGRGPLLRLSSLLTEMAEAHPGVWFRLMYAHPLGVDRQLLRVIRDHDNVCSYLDIPLQHASPSVLRRMGRSEDPQEVVRLLELIRERVPGISLRSAFIVGYPGETEDDFAALVDFVRRARLDHVGVFAYSREESTPAYSMPDQVPADEKNRRRNTLVRAASEVSSRVKQRLVGMSLPVLVDHIDGEEGVLGRHHGQAPEVDGYVFIEGGEGLKVGEVVSVGITGAGAVDLWGKLPAGE